jgi:hypothetical protein
MTMDVVEEGHELFMREPELMLSEVWLRALPSWSQEQKEKFVVSYFVSRHALERGE